ncbi:HNH endonuclease, partial [Mesorhizobium sp. M1A.F.Ca.IN.020.03.1.1]
SRQAGFDLIAKMNLDPDSRLQAEAAWRASTARTRMEALIARDPKRVTEMLSAGPVASDGMGETVRMQLGAGAHGEPGGAKGDRVDPRSDLSADEIQRLINQAHAATVSRLIEARAKIDLAAQNAPDAIANTGNYSGPLPSPADFTAIYGVEEGGERYQDFSRKIDVGRQAYGMRTMPNQAIHAALRGAEPGPGSSKEDQARYQATAAALLKSLSLRRSDPAGYVREVFPNVDAAWSKVTNSAGKSEINDREAYRQAIILSVAAQKQLGVENPQPLPRAFVQSIAEAFSKKATSQADKDTPLSDLLAAASDPGTEGALSQQVDQAGLYQPTEVDPITTAATGQQPSPSAGPAEPKSSYRQAAEDFLSEAFEALGRAPHDIGLALEDLRHSPWDFLEQLPVTPGSGAIAEGRLASEAVGEAVAKGLAIVRGGTGKLAKPLEELATNGARASSELAAEGAVARQAVETKSLVKAADDVAVSQAPTGQFYSVVFETKLDRALYPGASRPRHFQAANEALLVLMEREPDFAKVLQEGGITLQRTKRGLAPRTAPPGYTWHHAEEPGVMQLVPRYQHDFGTIFQKTLHPNRRGGFSLWGK